VVLNRILLDTSAYSAAAQGHPGLKDVLRFSEAVVVNPVVLGELASGFLGGSRATENRRLLERFLASARVQVAVIDRETAERYAVIQSWLRRHGKPIPSNDIWIAATAMQHGLQLVTTDDHFAQLPQIVVDLYPVQGPRSG
jgi:predicted nucleic acid-binding protein